MRESRQTNSISTLLQFSNFIRCLFLFTLWASRFRARYSYKTCALASKRRLCNELHSMHLKREISFNLKVRIRRRRKFFINYNCSLVCLFVCWQNDWWNGKDKKKLVESFQSLNWLNVLNNFREWIRLLQIFHEHLQHTPAIKYLQIDLQPLVT